jgi:hypothetical protein
VKLSDLFRRLGERFLSRWYSGGSNGVAPYVPPTPPSYPIPEDYNPFGNWTENPIYIRSRETYYRNLPELLKKHEGKWVCYRGEECLGIARTDTELWNRCYRRGWKPGEFFVGFICGDALNDKDWGRWVVIDPGDPLPDEESLGPHAL